jgi:hypothetical protein
MYIIKMAKYNLKSALSKIERVFTSGRAGKYYDTAKRIFNNAKALGQDVANDYSNPAMGKRRRRRRSTPKMGRRRRRR